MIWQLHRCSVDGLGFLPMFLSEADERPAREQINTHYAHGGGWQKFEGFALGIAEGGPRNWTLTYPNDPAIPALAHTVLRDEIIVLFQHEWLAIVQPDGSFEVARID